MNILSFKSNYINKYDMHDYIINVSNVIILILMLKKKKMYYNTEY